MEPAPGLAAYASLFDLSGRSAAVVGAGSGIGAACSGALAAFGAEVACADIEPSAAEDVSRLILDGSGLASSLALDVTAPDCGERLLAAVGVPDVLVLTAAISDRRRAEDIDDDAFARIVEVNLLGSFRLMRDVGRAMAERGSGSIIAFSSIRASVVEPGQSAYAATKAGVVQLVKTLAAELGPRGVRVNAVAPGVVDTPFTARLKADPEWAAAYARKTALGRWAQPHELTGAVVFLASDASSYVTGTELFVDGGWTSVDGRFDPPL